MITHLQKVTAYLARQWVYRSLSLNPVKSAEPCGPGGIHNFRFYGKKAVRLENYGSSNSNNSNIVRTVRATWQDARAALVEYLHSTRGLPFTDADLISKYSPRFLQKLLEKVVDCEPEDRARSLVRHLRFHPINEFEPFFESIGLEPSEYVPLIPRGLMFLSDDANLLENYQVLCNYGVPRVDIGWIYREAREVFGYGNGVLYSKLRNLEGKGMSQSDVIDIVCHHPHLLIGKAYSDFGNVLQILRTMGFQLSWIRRILPVNMVYNWRRIHELLCLFGDMGCDKEQLGSLIGVHPKLLFDGSGSSTFSLIGFKLKLGFRGEDIWCMLKKFPQVEVSKFVSNLKGAFCFLDEMEMDPADIERIIGSHYEWLGLCSLKKPATMLLYLRASKQQACDIIKEDPLVLKSWVRGTKFKRVPSVIKETEEMLKKQKINFLLNLGYAEDSEKMRDALKLFRGKGDELQDRFDCLVKAGLNTEVVSKMVKGSPKILNQSKENIEAKINCLVNELGYPISNLVSFPSFIAYTADRARLRHSMYKWLCDEGIADPNLALSTFVACSEKIFINTYVNSHPKGPQVWEEFKKKIYLV